MKIFITGTNGFIGRNLKEFLRFKNYNIYAPKRDEINLLDKKTVDNYIKSNQFDIIIHCAITLTSVRENLQMYYNIESNSKNFGKLLSIGSGGEFDKRNYISKMKESYFGKFIPAKSDIYGYSKYIIANDIIKKNKNIYNLRVFGIFGKYEDYRRRLISNNICRKLCGQNISINKNTFFDYIYIEDFCHIVEKFIICKPKENTYNICTGQVIDFLSIAKIISKVENETVIEVKEDGLNPEYSGNNEKFIEEFGSFNFCQMEIAIKKLYQWYKKDSGLIFDEKIFDNWIKN